VAGLPGNDDVSFFCWSTRRPKTPARTWRVAHMMSGLFPTSPALWVVSSSSRRLDFIHKPVRITFITQAVRNPLSSPEPTIHSLSSLLVLSFLFEKKSGTGIYLISTPLFRTITYPTDDPNKTATITTVNFDGAITNKYVVSATLNGVPFTRAWFAHHELFANGGVLRLTLGSMPSSWGTADTDLPPSISTSPLSSFS
jgi:Glycosyl hydrolase family 92 catalytic domain